MLIISPLQVNDELNLSLRQSGYFVQLGLTRHTVKDNGIGIAERDLNVIFDIFKRLHGKGGEFDGSGIGLATCYRIIQRHKGKIWCVSEENKGSVFFFTIPEHVD